MSADFEACAACGAEERVTETRGSPWACSPCRAELFRTVEVRLSRHTRPAHVVERAQRAARDRMDDAAREQAALEWLRGWANALSKASDGAWALLRALEAKPPDTEAVADACAGPWGPVRLERVVADPDVLCVGGLSPAVARRLAETVDGAHGPTVTPEALQKRMGREV